MTGEDPWKSLFDRLESGLLAGSRQQPLSEEVAARLSDWGVSLSDDPALALLEANAHLHFLMATALPPVGKAEESQAAMKGTPAMWKLLHDLLRIPGGWSLPEAAGLMRRAGLSWPDGACEILTVHLRHHPEWFSLTADLFDASARRVMGRSAPTAWLFPAGPPPDPAPHDAMVYRHLLHWLWQQPRESRDWLTRQGPCLDPAWWDGFLGECGHLLPPPGTDGPVWLPEVGSVPAPGPLIRARIRQGDTALTAEATQILGQCLHLDKDFLRLALPPPGPSWGSFWPETTEVSPTRSDLFRALAGSLPATAWTAVTGMDWAAMVRAAFESPDGVLLAEGMADALRYHPDPEGCAIWCEARLRHPDWAGQAPITGLAEAMGGERLNRLLLAYFQSRRPIGSWADPAGKMLTGPVFFWSEALTNEILALLALRPELAKDAARQQDFMLTLAWRGHLGRLSKSLGNPKPLDELPTVLKHHRNVLVAVLQLRIAFHQVMPK